MHEGTMTDPHAAPSQDSPAVQRAPGLPDIDVHERGGKREGVQQILDRRLFVQLLAFEVDRSASVSTVSQALVERLVTAGVGSVVYEDVNDPRGLALVTFSEDPAHFVRNVRPLFDHERLRPLVQRRDLTMLGRSYSLGHEPQLEDSLLHRPRRVMTDPHASWAVWYPLRRTGAFAKLDPHEQAQILREHAAIGMAYGAKELAHDVRLACHGMDQSDNEFIVGLFGRELHPLSHCVQTMRKTRQTSEFIAQMGPFFVGHVLARTPET
jgi:chlorite dismutase